ncbi:MAG: DsbA family protein, partial [Acidimicrobiales bacterium]|nr:DsbA family protein [Acidimicrobiales bacterium]
MAVEWKSFLLRPAPEERSTTEFTEYTKTWQRPAALEPKAAFHAPWAGHSSPPSHSLPAALASKTAAKFGRDRWQEFHMNLMRAYFTENRDISSSDVLLQVVKESGIDVDTFEQTQAENEQRFSRQVFDDYNEATNLGINGVPAVVIDDQYLISGAVDV